MNTNYFKLRTVLDAQGSRRQGILIPHNFPGRYPRIGGPVIGRRQGRTVNTVRRNPPRYNLANERP